MAHFYGRLHGSRGATTRCGTKRSGITATVESWQTIVRATQHCVGETNLAAITFVTKNGSRLFGVTFNADRVEKYRSDPYVKDALARVEEAFGELDRATADAKEANG